MDERTAANRRQELRMNDGRTQTERQPPTVARGGPRRRRRSAPRAPVRVRRARACVRYPMRRAGCRCPYAFRGGIFPPPGLFSILRHRPPPRRPAWRRLTVVDVLVFSHTSERKTTPTVQKNKHPKTPDVLAGHRTGTFRDPEARQNEKKCLFYRNKAVAVKRILPRRGDKHIFQIIEIQQL